MVKRSVVESNQHREYVEMLRNVIVSITQTWEPEESIDVVKEASDWVIKNCRRQHPKQLKIV